LKSKTLRKRSEMGLQWNNNHMCPFVKNPLRECYCFNLTSKTINSAIEYCGYNYQRCAIFKKVMKERYDVMATNS